MVTQSIDRPGLDDDDRGTGPDPCLGPHMCGVLRLVVVAQEAIVEIAPVRLIGDAAVRVAEDIDGRDMDDARDLPGDGGVEDALRDRHVRLVHGRPRRDRDADAVRARDMDDRVGAGHRVSDPAVRAQVALDKTNTDVA